MPRLVSAERRQHWPAVLLALMAGAIALWARWRIFPNFSWNRDESVYLWHIDILREGRLTSRDGGHPELFLPWLSASQDGGLFSQYTLGWPLVLLAADLLTGSAAAGLGFGAALAVIGTYAFAWELTRHRATCIGAAAVMVASPILPVQGGVHLSYLFTLGLGLLFGVGLLSGIRTRRMGWVVGAGLCLGWIFFTRPYDGLLWGLAFAAYAVVVHRDQWRGLVRPFVVAGMAALPLVAATLAYNRHVTGSLTQFPITAADPLDTFGFGRRRLMPGYPTTDYTPGSGLRAIAKHAFFFPWFLAGSYLGLAVGAVGLWFGRRQRATLALLLVGAVFPLGYFPFFGTSESAQFTRLAGPYYYLPLFTCLAILMAGVVVRLHARRRSAGIGLVLALLLATVPFAHSRLDINNRLSVRQEVWRQSNASIDDRALVVVADAGRYLLYANPFSANGPELDDRVLFATDVGPGVLDLIAEQPDRTPYLQRATVPVEEQGAREDPPDYDVELIPLEVRRAPAFALDVTTGAAYGDDVVVVEIRVEGGAALHRTVPRGGFLPAVRLGPPGSTSADLELPERGSLVIEVGYGGTEAEAKRRPTSREEVHFRVVDGAVEVLLPTAKLVRVLVGDELQWRRAVGLADLAVELTPASRVP
ncbi:MAG: hypothetical protein ABIP36_08655 [Acidimicrobiales bacterium]